jgi:hypothetical protein
MQGWKSTVKFLRPLALQTYIPYGDAKGSGVS